MDIFKRYLSSRLERNEGIILGEGLNKLSVLYVSGEIGYKAFMHEVENYALRYKYIASGKNISKMSRMMGVKRSSVYSMLLRHENVRDD